MKYKVNNKINLSNSDNYFTAILKGRGISKIDDYLNPSATFLNDPYQLDRMDKGLELYKKYIMSESPIFLIADCDNDGVTSAAMMYNYSKLLNPDCNIRWMMHSGKQHGIELDRIPEDTQLLIVPDAGSNQLEEHIVLHNRGVEILVLDHHLSDIDPEGTPAIIINDQMGEYPNRDLSGAGVVFKFLEACDKEFGVNYASQFLDLAAVGIIGDMMDLSQLETCYIVQEGLSHIRNSGLKYFIEKQAFSIKDPKHLSPTEVSFYITPLINAVIRVGTMEEKELLFRAFIEGDNIEPSTKRGAKAGDIEITGQKAARVASNAKSRQQKLREKGTDLVEMKIEKEDLNTNKILVVPLDDFESEQVDPNLTGLIAMQILAKYKKPTLIIREADDNVFKGSGRGDSNSDLNYLKDFLQESQFFEFAEGHECAFGCGIKANNIESFVRYANNKLSNIDLGDKTYTVDFEFTQNNLDKLSDCIYDLEQGNYLWGKGVEEPKIAVKSLQFSQADVKIMGKNNDSVKLQKNGVAFVKFKDADFAKAVSTKDLFSISMVGTTQINTFMGHSTPQFIIDSYNLEDVSLLNDDRFSF